MSVETIERGQWIFMEKSLPGYFIYRLLEGKVSIHHQGSKINEIEIKRGDKPILIGMISALRQDGMHIASVRSESQLRVERIYSDQVRGLLQNEAPETTRKDIKTAIETIVIRNEIDMLKSKFGGLDKVDIKVPDNLTPELKEVMESLRDLYKNAANRD